MLASQMRDIDLVPRLVTHHFEVMISADPVLTPGDVIDARLVTRVVMALGVLVDLVRKPAHQAQETEPQDRRDGPGSDVVDEPTIAAGPVIQEVVHLGRRDVGRCAGGRHLRARIDRGGLAEHLLQIARQPDAVGRFVE